MNKVELIPLKIDLYEDWLKFLENVSDNIKELIDEGDILVLASKVVLKTKKLFKSLGEVIPSKEAREIASRYKMDPRFVELILEYSKYILGGVEGVLLTYTGDIFTANAGLDRKNIGVDKVSLPPYLLRGTAREIYEFLVRRLGKKIGVVISDSIVYPLRLGTRAYAIDVYGFKPIRDYRGSRDLYGREIMYTRLNLADELASAAHLVMGEGRERIPVVLIKGVDIELYEGEVTDDLLIPPKECLYKDIYPEEILE